ncbi:MAG: hypothetical protein AAF518_25415 [Spirochaetota bacterium]
MLNDSYIKKFWENWPTGHKPDEKQVLQINQALREMLYSGLIKVKALETLGEHITKDKIYNVLLQKDGDFPEGEECVLSDNSEDYITLNSFKQEVLS